MKNTITKTMALVFSLIILFAPFFIFAQIVNPLKGLGPDPIPTLIKKVLVYIAEIGGGLAVFMFIYSGFLYVRALGNPTEIEKAKEVFKNTCIGTVLLVGATLIGSIISNTIGSLAK